MSARSSSLSKARWNRIDSSTQRLSRPDDSVVWKIDDHLRVDKKTKQRISFQCKMVPIKQFRMQMSEESVTETKLRLQTMLQQCHPTKQPTCKLYCLNDQLRMSRIKAFSNGPYHESLLYSEIKCWMAGVQHRDMFAIYVEESRRGRRSCEVYQCSCPDDVLQIFHLFTRAHQNPEYRLRLQSRALSIQSDLLRRAASDTTDYQNTSLPRLSFDTNDLPKIRQDQGSQASLFKGNGVKNGDSEPLLTQNDFLSDKTEKKDLPSQPVPSTKEPPVPPPKPAKTGNADSAVKKRLVTKSAEISSIPVETNEFQQFQDEWDQYVTYLEPDPVHGARITEHGSIYMFAMRVEANPMLA